jgi:hypothetical protein
MKAFFASGTSRMGWIAIWVVDEHGCCLHTEPICTVPSEWHQWFVDWLEDQECPMEFADLLTHTFDADAPEIVKPKLMRKNNEENSSRTS